jgi:hypothetical protein
LVVTISFGDNGNDWRFNCIFTLNNTIMINKPYEYWATYTPSFVRGYGKHYIVYEVNGKYNAYDPVREEYAVPEGTNPWPDKNDIKMLIYKKWNE